MQHFPIFLDLSTRSVVVSGGAEAAIAKLRLILKTPCAVTVYAEAPEPQILAWAEAGRITLVRRALHAGDAAGATLVYCAMEDPVADVRVAALARADGALVNIVDDLDGSDFITPALVDRDPLTVAIGTEGAAPVLARMVKADLEQRLPQATGKLAQVAKRFRPQAEALAKGAPRRDFWAAYYADIGPRIAHLDEAAIETALAGLLADHLARAPRSGHVDFVGAGPGDPELLTLKARNLLDRADVVIHDRLVAPAILELARREALLIEVGKEGFGPSVPQSQINALIVDHVRQGAHVVRLKSGDPGVFGRLDEETAAVAAAGMSYTVVPGITTAAAAAARLGQSLTRRGRNAEVRLLTGQDAQGLAEQDWRALARPGAVAAIYMGKRAARYIMGRLMMAGADPGTPVTIVENVSRPDERVLTTRLGRLEPTLSEAGLTGPAILLYGIDAAGQAVLTPGLEALA